MKLTKHQQLVMNAYNANNNCVNDDKDLFAAVWYSQGWNDNNTLAENLSQVANPESITRARRKLHELGMIKYTDKALKQRTEQFEQYREENSNNNWLGMVQTQVNKPDPFMER